MIELWEYGWSKDRVAPEGAARVVAVHRGRYGLMTRQGEVFAGLKGGVYAGEEATEAYPTVGDWVLVESDAYGTHQIVKTLPRKSLFSRSDGWSARGVQALAANFDHVLITSSLNRDLKISRLERYLAAARQSGGQPRIVLNKSDLIEAEDERAELADPVRAMAGVTPVHVVSARTELGMSELREALLPGQTLVFMGSSGVGKSSLINALAGEDLMVVNEVREDDDRGRHTTTHRQLFRLTCGLIVVDTPGMREFGLWDAQDGVSETFADVQALLGQCRFTNCGHGQEPGCAVRAAMESGALTDKRWRQFQQLEREARRAQRMAAREPRHSRAKAQAKERKRGVLGREMDE